MKRRAVVIGLGSIGRRHARLLKGREDITVEFCEPNAEVLARARQEVGEVIVKKFPMRGLGKAHVDGETEGFVKLVARAGTGEVLGVHIAAAEASSMIAEAALAMELEATAEELAETIHAHPTMPEGLHEAAEGVLGLAVNWAG